MERKYFSIIGNQVNKHGVSRRKFTETVVVKHFKGT